MSARRDRGGPHAFPIVSASAPAAVAAAVLLPATTFGLRLTEQHHSLSTTLLVYVSVVVAVSSIGGGLVGLVTAVASFLCANWFFTQPINTLAIANGEDLIALVVFLFVAAVVSTLVSVERRRAREARASGVDAEAVAGAAMALARSPTPIEALLDHLAGVVHGRPFTFEQRVDQRWEPRYRHGASAARLDAQTAVDADHRLRVGGEPLTPQLSRLLAAVASQLASAIASQRLRENADAVRQQAVGDAYRTALLRAVSHDLRTPLTSIKTSVSSLLASDITWSAAQQGEFLQVIDIETERLERLIADLLDMSRLQTGGVHARIEPVPVAELMESALASAERLQPPQCCIELEEQDVAVDADPALLERVLANLVANAERARPRRFAHHARCDRDKRRLRRHLRHRPRARDSKPTPPRSPPTLRAARRPIERPRARAGHRRRAADRNERPAAARRHARWRAHRNRPPSPAPEPIV